MGYISALAYYYYHYYYNSPNSLEGMKVLAPCGKDMLDPFISVAAWLGRPTAV